MKPLRILVPAVLIALLACTGCTDQPRLRMIGSPAPDFTVQDSDHTVALHDLHGKIVVLNFWTTWCEPCIVEMPSLVQLQKQMGSKVTVLAVSTDEDEAAYHNFLRKYHIDFLTVRDPNRKSADLYGTTGQPETFIIDTSGKLRRKFVGAVNWTSPEITDYLQKL
ncbi:MAG TPA: TlpA disulfide reductase family protein [Candidatus Angelobacter sp.]|nr:TlpA disulfide reductase family protein [Candidatus Angelobacter sp.]